MAATLDFSRWAAGPQYDFLAKNYRPLGIELTYAEGSYIFAADGTAYLDGIMGYGAGQFGHRHPKIVKAIEDHIKSQLEISRLIAEGQVKRGRKIPIEIKQGGLDLSTNNYTNPIRAEFGLKLGLFSGIADPVVCPKNGGGEIIDSAIKAMRADGVRRRGIPENQGVIIVFENCFHGRTYGAVSASSSYGVKRDFGPFLPGFVHVPYNSPAKLAEAMQRHRGKVSGVMIEAIQGEAGVKIPMDGYLQYVQDLCDAHNTILMLDEIQSGWGRTGTDWAYQQFLKKPPHLMTTAKGIGTGMVASSALIGERQIMNIFDPGSDGATMAGSPLACAIGIAAMEIMAEENISKSSRENGYIMKEKLAQLRNNLLVKDVRGVGSWWAIEFASEEIAQAVANYLVTVEHVLCVPSHESLRISTALNAPRQIIEEICDAVVSTVNRLEHRPAFVAEYTFH